MPTMSRCKVFIRKLLEPGRCGFLTAPDCRKENLKPDIFFTLDGFAQERGERGLIKFASTLPA